MEGDIESRTGRGVLKHKNVNCEGRRKPVVFTLCTNIIDLSKAQKMAAVSTLDQGSRRRC